MKLELAAAVKAIVAVFAILVFGPQVLPCMGDALGAMAAMVR